MPQYDLDAAGLAAYRSPVAAPADLAGFWHDTLDESRSNGWAPKSEAVRTGLRLVDTWDVTFAGYRGDPIRAWLHRPAGATGDLPLVVQYIGYECGRGLPHVVNHFALAGYACLSMDNRGQGCAAGYVGDTPDPAGSPPSVPGFLTRGILDRDTFYYRRLFTDAVLAVDAARQLPGVDPSRIAVAGTSQGAGIALAVAGLTSDLVAVMADVPFLSDMPRGVAIAGAGPYLELVRYLGTQRHHAERAFEVLAHFDAAVLARTATAPASFSVALMDQVCPPSTVYAAYHAYGGPKHLTVYPFNDHEGGQYHQEAAQLAWLLDTVPPT